MDWIVLISKFFDSVNASFNFLSKTQPPPEERKARFDIEKPRLEATEMKKILRQSSHYIFNHRKTDIDTYVEFTYGNLSEQDKAELKKLLHDRYTKK